MATKQNPNLRIYAQLMNTPKEAQKEITAGKLKGMTDINPMARIKMMTEVFGPQGLGWKFELVRCEVVEAAGEKMASVVLNLFYKETPESDWSGPIIGVGGSKLCGKGVGDGVNDEAFKMAFTDAQGICFKGLGMCADIYYSKDRTKYNSIVETPQPASEQQQELTIPFTVEEAKNDFAHCENLDDFSTVYNGKYGGNKGLNQYTGHDAVIAKAIKAVAGERVRQLGA